MECGTAGLSDQKFTQQGGEGEGDKLAGASAYHFGRGTTAHELTWRGLGYTVTGKAVNMKAERKAKKVS